MNTNNKRIPIYATMAPTLKVLGYDPLPVHGKAVRIKDWTKMEITPEWVNKQATNDSAYHNVGIRCSDTVVGIDIDVRDKQVAKKLHEWLENRLGDIYANPVSATNLSS